MAASRRFDVARWVVVVGTGRRQRVVGYGCNLCPRGRCDCLRNAWSFARLVGGEVMAVEARAA